MAAQGDQPRLHAAFLRRAAALRALGAQHLVENLLPGAKPLALSRLEGKLGAPLPRVLRTWWLLHDGEKKPAEGFAAPFHLLPVAWVLNERVTVLRRWERFLKAPEAGPPSGLTEAERTSPRWIPVAARPGVSVVLHGTTGRVFECGDEAPFVRLVAPSLVAWFEAVVDQPLEEADEPPAST
ncbi:MAG: SMI1/KNR4 family protein [Myxococcaceae bacterium]|jgi:cell wall assembly regulator SMI1|nr:SMI1/KNR4 family protein [Myxococcaceae bacterium]